MALQGWSSSVDHRDDTYVAGHWVRLTGEQRVGVVDPSTGDRVATVRESSEADVDLAVAAARTALPVLAALGVDERIDLLERLSDELEKRATAFSEIVTTEMGMPVKHCAEHQVSPAIAIPRTTARAVHEVPFSEVVGHSRVHRRPAGVVAAITPWCSPLTQILGKLAPAFAAGCPVVLKPSEQTPLDAFLLAEAVDAAGFPAGAFGLALGNGPQVGETLAAHPGVALVSLTGSRRAGKRVAQLAARGVKRAILELGGKSPAVVLQDADLATAVRHTVASVMLNSGQNCTALTRLLIPFERLAEAEVLVAAAMAEYVVGAPHDPLTDVGPLASEGQFHEVGRQLERATLDGARPVWEHDAALPGRGYFLHPAAYVVTEPGIELVQEEVLAPVLAVIPYVDEPDAVGIANATSFGLTAAVWSADEEHAARVALTLDAGSVDINGAPSNDLAPFGGHKQSGYGRELGVHGILEFTEPTSLQYPGKAAR